MTDWCSLDQGECTDKADWKGWDVLSAERKWEPDGIWPLPTPVGLRNAVLGCQAHANVDELRRSRLSWWNHKKGQILFEDVYHQKLKGQLMSYMIKTKFSQSI